MKRSKRKRFTLADFKRWGRRGGKKTSKRKTKSCRANAKTRWLRSGSTRRRRHSKRK